MEKECVCMDFADVRAIRREMNLTQEAFARRLGVAVATVSRWERPGGSRPSRMAATKLKSLEKRLGLGMAASANGPSGEGGLATA